LINVKNKNNMKKVLLFLAVLLSISFMMGSCVVNPSYMGLEEKNPEKYKLADVDLSCRNFLSTKGKEVKIYKLDKDILKSVINNSDKDYFMLYAYNSWCSSAQCGYFDTVLHNFQGTRDIQLILICADNILEKESTERFLNAYRFYYPTFFLDANKYGNKRNLFSAARYTSFISDVNPRTKTTESMNSYVFLDKSLNIISEGLYKSSTYKEMLELIKTSNGNE